MKVQSTYRGRTYKEVTIEDAEVETDDTLIGFALRHANEHRANLFGISVNRWPLSTTATVTLHTD